MALRSSRWPELWGTALMSHPVFTCVLPSAMNQALRATSESFSNVPGMAFIPVKEGGLSFMPQTKYYGCNSKWREDQDVSEKPSVWQQVQHQNSEAESYLHRYVYFTNWRWTVYFWETICSRSNSNDTGHFWKPHFPAFCTPSNTADRSFCFCFF